MRVSNLFHNDHSPARLFSMNALRRAWNQVQRSGKSPGTDGMTPEEFGKRSNHHLNRLRQQIINGSYEPHPVRQFFIKKKSGKQRPIRIWTVRDKVAQRVVVDAITPVLEQHFLDCSFGFRPGRSVKMAVQAIEGHRNTGNRWVLDADIKDCFGSIDLYLLMGQVTRMIPTKIFVTLIQQWLYTPIDGVDFEVAAVSQGGVISPLLANLYLHRFDEMMRAALPQSKLVRFADDFITLNATDDEAVWSLEVARRSLENLKLKMNMRKTG
ncbi:MAG: reverse transcriptase domain-containing protein, partial [Chloroflexota bacterium]